MPEIAAIRPAVVGAPGGEAPPLGVQLIRKVNVCRAIQQVSQVQTRTFEMQGVDLEIAPIEGAVGVVVVGFTFALGILRSLNR